MRKHRSDAAYRDWIVSRREALAWIGMPVAALLAGLAPQRARAQATAGQARPLCVARPEQTEGPFFVDEALNRSDIRSDPRSGELKTGVPLRVAFNVSRLDGTTCAPLTGARVDVWHSDATGRYSDVTGFGSRASTAGQQFLRGYQITDGSGGAQFLTIFPGWYGGRAVHLHFKIRSARGAVPGYTFTSQLYFDDAVTERVFAVEPYASRGRRWMRNEDDGIFREGGKGLLLAAVPDGDGYAASFDIGLQV
jgi:protocatechuate 3,4-dioxygenase beta subunit